MKKFLIRLSATVLSLMIGAAMGAKPMEPSKTLEAVMSKDTQDFFESAASAGMFEIEASKLALQRATDPALKDFAKMMVADHTKASEELKALAAKKNVTLPTAMLKRHEAMLKDLKHEKDGDEFDDEYRDKMISSHKEAVSLFDKHARKSDDPDVQAFAAKMLPKLQEHGGKAKELPDH